MLGRDGCSAFCRMLAARIGVYVSCLLERMKGQAADVDEAHCQDRVVQVRRNRWWQEDIAERPSGIEQGIQAVKRARRAEKIRDQTLGGPSNGADTGRFPRFPND